MTHLYKISSRATNFPCSVTVLMCCRKEVKCGIAVCDVARATHCTFKLDASSLKSSVQWMFRPLTVSML